MRSSASGWVPNQTCTASGGSGTPRLDLTSPCCRPIAASALREASSPRQSASRSKSRLIQLPSGALAAETHGRRGRDQRQPPQHQVGALLVAPRGAEARAPAHHGEADQGGGHQQGRGPGRSLQHVPARHVGQLVRHHHAHLVGGEVPQQGVVEHDVAAAAVPRHVGVGGRGARARRR